MAKRLTYEELEARVRELEAQYTALEGRGTSKEGEINFFKLADETNDCILMHDPEGKYVYANESAAKVIGYSISEILTKNFRDLVHPDDLEMVSKKFDDRMEGKLSPGIYEGRFIRKDATTVYIEVSGTRLLWNEKPFVLVIARDVTDRKEGEKSLREREELYRAALESTVDGIALIGENQQVIIFNSLFGEMWKIPEIIIEEGDNEKIREFVLQQIENPQEFLSQS
ncbi:MAG: PAS domain S-box protein, partial [Syntrophobacterales bacterium]